MNQVARKRVLRMLKLQLGTLRAKAKADANTAAVEYIAAQRAKAPSSARAWAMMRQLQLNGKDDSDGGECE